MPHSLAYQLICELWQKNRNFCSTDYDYCLDYIHSFIPLKIYTYTPHEIFNGWVIPPKWDLVKGEIWKEGQCLFQSKTPLNVIGLSSSFCGTISLEELKKHLHFDARFPQAVPYHFRQNYRPWNRDWGFCVTQDFYHSLTEGLYEVKLFTQESEGYLKVAEHTHVGENPETFVFVAHLDHGGMANDDLAGVAVGVELFHRLLPKKTKFSYKLVLVQEIVGSAYYLGKTPETKNHVLESIFLEMLGSNTPLALQHSHEGKSQLENTLAKLLKNKAGFREGPFRSVICNDEMIWESYGIPMSSISRFPYPEYHSDLDNLSIINQEALDESVSVLLETIETLDRQTFMRKKFSGVIATAHPDYNLYVEPGQRAFGIAIEEDQKKLRLLMDLLPIMPQECFIEQIAAKIQARVDLVFQYLQQWEEKGLIELI
ncbi:DUF4910 domain-containing protein [Parachlamydia sp. AcF125]|uniref:DUF4910 domain-containing protein n=1 Tax=Parachlamydia sp. AcF125 TaxID=2795736 RepID=UPI001BD8AD84|nr:DUF4910 domain-containing protein [Parachlamydia sp. AcF125]MBS4169086.1 putative polysaccharide biosynthesis protein with aminopeptidase-like domain protein [Parachlamydia sp. AcF125]